MSVKGEITMNDRCELAPARWANSRDLRGGWTKRKQQRARRQNRPVAGGRYAALADPVSLEMRLLFVIAIKQHVCCEESCRSGVV